MTMIVVLFFLLIATTIFVFWRMSIGLDWRDFDDE